MTGNLVERTRVELTYTHTPFTCRAEFALMNIPVCNKGRIYPPLIGFFFPRYTGNRVRLSSLTTIDAYSIFVWQWQASRRIGRTGREKKYNEIPATRTTRLRRTRPPVPARLLQPFFDCSTSTAARRHPPSPQRACRQPARGSSLHRCLTLLCRPAGPT